MQYQKKILILQHKFKIYNIMKAEVKIGKTKSGKTTVRFADDNRKLDKCSMSMYFPAYSVEAIYWDTISYERMVEKFLELPNITTIKI